MASGGDFQSTQWGQVMAARDPEAPGAQQALAALCQTYWPAIYAYIRRRGHAPDQAEDLTQTFFADRVLREHFFKNVGPQNGRFRAFLLAACKNFLNNDYRHNNALKAGGGRIIFSIDARVAEEGYRQEPADTLTPEVVYDRRWATALIDSVLDQIRVEYEANHQLERFMVLRPAMTKDGDVGYAELGRRLALSEDAVKQAVSRLRKRFRELLTTRIAETVGSPGEVQDELHALFEAFRTN